MLNVSVKIKTVSIEPEFFKRGLAMLGNGLIKQIYFNCFGYSQRSRNQIYFVHKCLLTLYRC